jgi:PAS domain S-box-containing protein
LVVVDCALNRPEAKAMTDDSRGKGPRAGQPDEGEQLDAHHKALRSMGIGLLRVTPTGVVLWMDEQARDLLGHALLATEQPGGAEERLLTLGHGGKQPWDVVLERGRATGLSYGVRDADGKLRSMVFEGTCETGSGGAIEVVLFVRRNEGLERTDDPYRAVFDEVNDGILVHDIETGAILDMNRRAAELYKYKKDEAPPTSPHETTDRPAEQANAQAFALMLKAAAGEPQVFEWPAVDREGRAMCLEVNLKRASVGGVDRLLAVVRDTTDRKRTEQELRESQERYRAIIEASHDIIWALDANANFVFCNKRGEELTGFEFAEWKGKSFVPLVYPEDLPKAQSAFQRTMAGERVRYEVRVLDSGGRVRQLQANLEPLREDGRIIGMVGLGTDITERTRMEDELHKAQKLESLGLLAGGIAHDFNNILTAIVGGVTLARRCVQQPELQQETLEMAEKACIRARELTQQLLTFSRGGAPVRKPGSIAELLQETARFALRGSNVRCEISLQDDLHIVEMDAGQMSQVVNNLLINAAQAMPKGGTVSLCAVNHGVEDSDGRRPSLRPGSYVHISVRDEGDGIPDAHLPNIFDPYFTTKPAGTGLGLATCYSIVRRHDGHIEVETHPGRGTTFHIYLPSTERTCPPSEEPPMPESKRGGAILLMDDDAMVREVGAEMLRLLGFEVVMVNDGHAAIQKYREALEAGHRFDAVILDLTVPGAMGGREAAGILRRIDKHARLIASSGYSTDPVMADHAEYGFDGVVAKPYMPEDLDRAMGMVFRASR